MSRTPVTYPIRAVSVLTGVSIDTLRAWERRYGAVTPVRDQRGRLYSDADVRRLTLLRDAVAQGHAIGRIARLPEAQLAKLVHAKPSAPEEPRMSSPVDTRLIVDALDRFDASAVETELARAAALLRPAEVLREVLMPVLADVGDRWHDGRARIAHEHMLSATVRNVLGSLLRIHSRAGVPDRLLFATPAGERHEFGTLGAATLAASGGLGVIYLGPDLPADDIVAVTEVVPVDVVVLGVSDAGDADRVDREVASVARRLDARIELWLGGRGAERASKRLRSRATAVPTYEALQQQLLRLGARF
jgi:DNA-binding transcriptional MerR regulator/methylmalonyl-CoA mutase cobalamin-binding subunit